MGCPAGAAVQTACHIHSPGSRLEMIVCEISQSTKGELENSSGIQGNTAVVYKRIQKLQWYTREYRYSSGIQGNTETAVVYKGIQKQQWCTKEYRNSSGTQGNTGIP